MSSERVQEIARQPLADVEEPVRELTVGEAIEIALELQKVGRLADAEMIYREVLQAHPNQPRALHYAGVLAHQAGRSAEGVELIRRSLEIVNDAADWHSNLGIVLQESGRFEEAIEAYRRAIALEPNHANAYSNLGAVLRATGRMEEAEASYRTAIGIDPEHIDAYTNLGILLNVLRRTQEAATCFCRVVILRPKHREARRMLALAHCILGEVDKATAIFEEWLAEEPDDPVARHMLAACSGRGTPARASDDFVSRTFDVFAASFESKLAKLSYRAPALIGAVVEDMLPAPAKNLDVLDAGCGTGLCGPGLAPYARRLTGVDLSAGMLAHAAEKKVYDDLLRGELTAFLAAHPNAYDLIVSADTLCYFGALDDVIAAAAGALRPGGLVVFTLEHGAGDAAPDYHLDTHGRYTHGRPYVERVLAANALDPEIAQADLRMESGVPVAGLVVWARKGAAGR
jgi:predicted TPR repeat methyltransferase